MAFLKFMFTIITLLKAHLKGILKYLNVLVQWKIKEYQNIVVTAVHKKISVRASIAEEFKISIRRCSQQVTPQHGLF